MIAFDVIKNGQRLATAGGEDLSVLTVIVNAIGKLGPKSNGTVDEKSNYELFLSTGGLTSRGPNARDEHVRWSEHEELKIGDEICIRILESDSVVLHSALAGERYYSFYAEMKDRPTTPSRGSLKTRPHVQR